MQAVPRVVITNVSPSEIFAARNVRRSIFSRLDISGNDSLTFYERSDLPVTEAVEPHQGQIQKPPDQLRKFLIELPGVMSGTRFGGEAFFFRKRFFCHFHPTREHLLLETFVWNNVEAVTREVPGTIPHPEYGGYGWVRLPIDSEDAVSKGRQLIETTYGILRTTRRVSIAKEDYRLETLGLLGKRLPEIRVRVKESKKRNQIVLEARGVSDYEKADVLLDKAMGILKGPRDHR